MLETLCTQNWESFLSEEYYLPFLLVTLALGFAFSLAKTFNRNVLTGDKTLRLGSHDALTFVWERFRVITPPFFSLITLSLCDLLMKILGSDRDLTGLLINLALIWWILACIWALTSSRNITTLFAVVCLATLLFNAFGLLSPTVRVLDAWSLHLGSYNFTMYQLVKGTLVLMVLILLTRRINDYGHRCIHSLHNINVNTRELLALLFQIFLYFLVAFIVLDLMGVNLTSLTIFSGALAFGVGLGAQRIAASFLSGMTLLFEKSLEIGDIIELKDGSWVYVRHLGPRAAIFEGFDGREIIMPNEELITMPFTNLTYSHSRLRSEFYVRVPYEADLELARRLILEAARSAPLSSRISSPQCFLYEFGECCALFLVYIWIDDVVKGRYMPQSEAMLAIWKALKEHGIDAAYPKRVIV